MPQYGTWSPYTGLQAVWLAVAMLVLAGVLLAAALKLKEPLKPPTTGLVAGGLLCLIGLVSFLTFGVNAITYFEALVASVGNFTPPRSPISPVTDAGLVLSFIVIVLFTRRAGWRWAAASAIAGAIAAPMVFELPFDLIIMGHIYPTPPEPTVRNTLMYFLPLMLIALTSFALLTVSPLMRLTRYSLFCLAGMFFVFAVWALFGFAYPSQPVLWACNALAKVLAFASVVMLFAP